MAEQDDDRASVDRAFAELVAGYHLTAEREEPQHRAELTVAEPPAEAVGTLEPNGTTALVPPPRPDLSLPLPRPIPWRAAEAGPSASPGADERYVPEPLPPLSRPAAPVLAGWVGVLFAAVVVLAAGFGVHLPRWLGWVAVTCFIVGFVVLLTQLPRHRPPDAGDGAVL